MRANAARNSGDKKAYVTAVLEAVLETACLRFGQTVGTSDEACFVNFLREEWVVFQAGIGCDELRRFGNSMHSVPAIFYRLQEEFAGKVAGRNTPLTLLGGNGRLFWFEPEGDGFVLNESWFDVMARIVAYSPENCVGQMEDAPAPVVTWMLFGRPDVSYDKTLAAYMTARAARIETARNASMQLLLTQSNDIPGNLTRAYQPDDRDELAYQIINLRLLCQSYNQGMRTLYKPASVCLRTLLLRSSGIDPLALQLGSPMLPQLLVSSMCVMPGHFTAPSRLCINNQLNFAAGSGFQNINIEGGATGRVRFGDLFMDTLMPMDAWLAQPFLKPGLTLEKFIRTVVHKDGGAHYETGNPDVATFELGASFHWPLTIKIGETVAASLWSQFQAVNPTYDLQLP